LRIIKIPLEPLFQRKTDRGQSVQVGPKIVTKKLLPVPPFRVEELGRNPEPMLRALYSDRPHQYHEDGLRFKTLALLQEHTNAFLERKKVLKKKKESTNVRECREWYCSAAQWVSDFSRLQLGQDASTEGGVTAGSSSAAGEGGDVSGVEQQPPGQQQEVFIVPADEHFTRCPISREMFEAFFDEEEGEFMYRNAAKVLVTESADPSLFKLGRETEGGVQSGDNMDMAVTATVRYLIVHKVLVLDSWLQSGKATTLSEALQRYATVPAAVEVIKRLLAAAGEEENEDDVFVVLDLFS